MPPKNLNTTDYAPSNSNQHAVKIKSHQLLILRTLQKKRCQLSLVLEGLDVTSVSIILELDVKNNWLELDELADSEAHNALLETKNYLASGWQNGIHFRFSAAVISYSKNGGFIRYRCALPDIIYQNQSRAGYRTPVSIMSAPEVQLILSDNQVVKGHISDISMNGALVTVPADSPIDSGDHIAQCIFNTLDGKMVIVEADVRRVVGTEHSSRTKLGCRFINLDQPTRQDIQRYAAAVERLNARRR